MSREEIIVSLFGLLVFVMGFLSGWFARVVWVLSGCQ